MRLAELMLSPATVVFYGLAALSVGGGLGVALFRDVLASAFSLLAALLGVAGLYLYLGADFVGMTQLLVYVGGVLVLLLFSIMLTRRIGRSPESNPSGGRLLGALGATALTVGLAWLATHTRWPAGEHVAAPSTARIGDALLREYVLPFELASVLLLAALVGSLVLGRRAARESAELRPRKEAP